MPGQSNQRALYRRYSTSVVNDLANNEPWPQHRGIQRSYGDMTGPPLTSFEEHHHHESIPPGQNDDAINQGSFKPNRKRYKTIDSAWVHSLDCNFQNLLGANEEWNNLQTADPVSPTTNDGQSMDNGLQPSWTSQLQLYESMLEKSKHNSGFISPHDNNSSFDSFHEVFPTDFAHVDHEIFSLQNEHGGENAFRTQLIQSHHPTPDSKCVFCWSF
jgi:hypothetical protein